MAIAERRKEKRASTVNLDDRSSHPSSGLQVDNAESSKVPPSQIDSSFVHPENAVHVMDLQNFRNQSPDATKRQIELSSGGPLNLKLDDFGHQ